MLATATLRIAKSCQYFRPVGKKDGVQKFAEGAGIRLAEIMKSKWGNIQIAKRVIGTRDGMIGVAWAAWDLEANVRDMGEVWRPYFNNDKMIPVITSAAMKFAERDAVFAIVPKSYADEVLRECKKMICGDGQQKADTMIEAVAAFGELGVLQDKLMSSIDRKNYPVGSDDELVFLIGLYNAIKDGICSVEDVFGKGSTKPEVSMPVEQPQKATPAKDSKKKPAVTPPKEADDIDGALMVRSAAASVGIKDEDKLCKILIEKFEIQTPEDVPADALNKVIDYFSSQTAGA
jgi:hypothetical protein